MKVTLIGDVHGKWLSHRKILNRNENTITLGDINFKYGYLNQFSSDNHKMLAGNHDNLDELRKYPHNLGDFGVYNRIFFVRGAWSIDQQYRTVGIDWWENEELTYEECVNCIDLYNKRRPQIVISHDCPAQIYHCFGYNGQSKTSAMLQNMFESHRPNLWFFGHHHRSLTTNIHGTEFHCLAELETFQLIRG